MKRPLSLRHARGLRSTISADCSLSSSTGSRLPKLWVCAQPCEGGDHLFAVFTRGHGRLTCQTGGVSPAALFLLYPFGRAKICAYCRRCCCGPTTVALIMRVDCASPTDRRHTDGTPTAHRRLHTSFGSKSAVRYTPRGCSRVSTSARATMMTCLAGSYTDTKPVREHTLPEQGLVPAESFSSRSGGRASLAPVMRF